MKSAARARGVTEGLELFQIDAFAERPFEGNPAAVVPLEREPPADWMQRLARELNLSETAFLWPAGGAFGLRWFTPGAEVRLCGHATLASAHALWESGRIAPAEAARFDTLSGVLTCVRRSDGAIEMEFPARPSPPVEPPPGLLGALGIDRARYVGRNVDDWLVEVASAEAVRRLVPDFRALRQVEARGVVVTAPADAAGDPPCDFVSRFFAPGVGVDEDPVTGSAHCALGPHWSARLGRGELVGRQLSARGGRVGVRVAGERVFLSGCAVTILRGTLAAAALPG
jgi:PhzF family phenazine biosynthesis protein